MYASKRLWRWVRARRIFLRLPKAILPRRIISAMIAVVCSANVMGEPSAAITVLCGSHVTVSPPIVKVPPPVGLLNRMDVLVGWM